MFREVSSNSYSIAAIFGEDTSDFNKPKIIGLDQSFLNIAIAYSCVSMQGLGKYVDIEGMPLLV